MIGSGSDDCTLKLWDGYGERSFFKSISFPAPVTAIETSEYQLYCASIQHLYWFDLRKLPEKADVSTLLCVFEDAEEINDLSLSSNLLAGACDSGSAFLFSLDDKVPLTPRSPHISHENLMATCAFNPKTHNQLVTGALDSRIRVWEIESSFNSSSYSTRLFHEISTLTKLENVMHNPPFVYSLDISESGETIACAIGDTVGFFISDEDDDYIDIRMRKHSGIVAHVHFAAWATEYQLISAGADRAIHVWDLSSDNIESPVSSFQVDFKPNVTASLQSRDIFIGGESSCIQMLRLEE